MKQAELLVDCKLELGEGPVWHPIENKFYCVDIKGKYLCRYDHESAALIKWSVGQEVGAAVPDDQGNFLLALQSGLTKFNLQDGSLTPILAIEEDLPHNRLNDGKCDPKGRFWVGSMDNNEQKTTGQLYAYDGITLNVHLNNIGISNGMAWSADGKTMYYIDTLALCVMAYNFDLDSGSLHGGSNVISIDKQLGYPDGMTIDQEGKLWIAHWGGSCIRRWDPENGSLLTTVQVPAAHATSCAFGGPNYDTLYITTARKGLTANDLAAQPLSGGIFIFTPEVGGLACHLYATS